MIENYFLKKLLTSTKYSDILINVAYAIGIIKFSLSGKEKRMGRYVGKTSDWKKAIVTIDTNPEQKTYLAKGGKQAKISKKYKDSIDEFMGA